MKAKVCLILLPALIASVGCETMWGPSPEAVRREHDMQALAEKVRQLEEQVKGLQAANQLVMQDMESVKATARSGTGAQGRIETLEKQLQTLRNSREQERGAIVDELSRKMSSLSASSGSARSTTGTEYGYEHIVRSGDTLSEIAKAYGVSSSAIMKANRLKSSQVRVGQKLFIPDTK